MLRLCHLVAAASTASLVACGPGDGGARPAPAPPPASPTWFWEHAAASGLDFVHVRAHQQRFWIPETVTGGGGFLDYDGDGRLDVYCVQGGDPVPQNQTNEPNRLFRQEADGTFTDVTDTAGVGDRGYGFGCTAGDHDGDGDTDLYVCNLEGNVLFRNEGDGTFTDVTEAAGVGEPRWSSAASFFDYDRDGDLDLFVVNYLNWKPEHELPCQTSYGERDYCNPINYNAPTRDTLYRNEGDGTFTDVSEQVGLGAGTGTGLGLACADFDGDGRVDVYVTNDGMPNHLWLQLEPGRFTDRALLAGCAVNSSGAPEAGMGVHAVDVESDGDWDLFMTHVREQTNTFYRNQGSSFADTTASTGLSAASVPFTGFGLGFHDFDLDGEIDLFVANGRVGLWPPALSETDPYAEPNQLFLGRGDGRFEEVPGGGAPAVALGTSRAAAFGDVDDDGDVDILYIDAHASVRLLQNDLPRAGNWIGLSVLGESTAAALGATVRVRTGERDRFRIVHTSYSYCATNDPRVHLGLGAAERADEVEVRWPDGQGERFGPLEAGRYHTLRKGEGR
ncbi:MAG: CRTAC1 family protein [Planctomycetota bacterium]|jgi:hypothetical protein|nr:CRTAC1 family protein [Planctomycetota bacterium]MDP6990896.1 CRTAC1 family protein [Planctomycetota bacterium]